MTLREWLKKEDMTQQDFADLAKKKLRWKIHREMVNRWCNGLRPIFASRTFIQKITGGEVNVDQDWGA
jgi:transcriptional regulator with XRE-family HTH domain